MNYIKRNSGIPFETIEIDISKYSDEEKLQFAEENIVEEIKGNRWKCMICGYIYEGEEYKYKCENECKYIYI